MLCCKAALEISCRKRVPPNFIQRIGPLHKPSMLSRKVLELTMPRCRFTQKPDRSCGSGLIEAEACCNHSIRDIVRELPDFTVDSDDALCSSWAWLKLEMSLPPGTG